MVLIDRGAHSEHISVFGCDIKPGSVGRFRDVENGMVSEKIPWVQP
jgi:hypothetical protein